MLNKPLFFILLLIFSFTNQCFGQVKFFATLSAGEIGKHDFVQFKLIVENANAVEKIVNPNLKDFELQSGPNPETGMTSVNGQVKKYYALTYILKPKNAGVFVLQPTIAVADGKEYSSNSVVLKVTRSSSAKTNPVSPLPGLDMLIDPVPEKIFDDYILKQNENPENKVKQNMFLRVEVSKTTAFVGEPVVATYKLYTRLKSESNLIKNPSFNGFSVVDMEQRNPGMYNTEKYKGKEYNVYTIRKVQLYPLQEGVFEIEPAEVENLVYFIKESYVKNRREHIFDDFGEVAVPTDAMEKFKINLKNEAVPILIKPLPKINMPANFKGAVGNFNLVATIDKNKLTTDETGELRLILSGEGNLTLVTLPDINWPQNIEAFEPKQFEELSKLTVPVSGNKKMTYPFTVNVAGEYKLDSISLTFFDSKEKKYTTIYTRPIYLSVAKGTGKKALPLITEKPSANWISNFFSHRKWVISGMIILGIAGLFFWNKMERKKSRKPNPDPEVVKNPAAQILEEYNFDKRNWLESAQKKLMVNDDKDFYQILNGALKNYLAFKTGIEAGILSKKNIQDWMDKAGYPISLSVGIQQFFEEIEGYIYMPVTEKKSMEKMYEKAGEIIQRLGA